MQTEVWDIVQQILTAPNLISFRISSQLSETMFRCQNWRPKIQRSPTFQRNARLMLLYNIYCTHLKIPGVVECPGAGQKLTVKFPGAGNFFCANARGYPGGMVRVGIERDISSEVQLIHRLSYDFVNTRFFKKLGSGHITKKFLNFT